MLNTYLNDNQHRPYPFYGGVKLPFPDSCITGLGLCIQVSDNDSPVYASVIAISANSVRVALCRGTGANAEADEFIGMLYANTSGYYTYISSSSDSAAYEVDTEQQPVDINRLGYATFPELSADDQTSAMMALADMQAFYAYVYNISSGIPRSSIRSTGYMQLGTIPEDAIGVYTGRFYLDPSCTTYMTASVYGYHTAVQVRGAEQETAASLNIVFNGLLTASVDGGTLFIGATTKADDNILNEVPTHSVDFVEYLCGTTTANIDTLNLVGDPGKIVWSLQDRGNVVVVSVDGTSTFPNCWGSEDDAHVAAQ